MGLSVPAEKVKAAKGKQGQSRAAKERDKTERAPQDCPARGHVAGLRVIGEVVRVGKIRARPVCGGGPCGPEEKGVELAQFIRVGDVLGGQSKTGFGRGKELRQLAALCREAPGLGLGDRQHPGRGVVSVDAGFARSLGPNGVLLFGCQGRPWGCKAGLGQILPDMKGLPVQILCRKIRAQIGAMPPDRPVLHQPIFQKHLLAGADVVAGEHGFPRSVDHAFRDGRSIPVGPHRKGNENGESRNHHHDHGVLPPGRQLFPRRFPDVHVFRAPEYPMPTFNQATVLQGTPAARPRCCAPCPGRNTGV